MLRYLALLWDERNARQCAAAQRLEQIAQGGAEGAAIRGSTHWQLAARTAGARIWCADAHPLRWPVQRFADDCAVLLGPVFAMPDVERFEEPADPLSLTPAQQREVIQSSGRWLIDRAWGNYVALMHDAASRQWHVLKDPCGSLPCFLTAHAGITICFSHVTDVLALDLPAFTVDEDYARAQVVSGIGAAAFQPFREVVRVQLGQRARIAVGSENPIVACEQHWPTLPFLDESAVIEDADHAARAVHASVRSACATWAGLHSSALIRLSGGLDSSIVAGCLRDASATQWQTYTYFNPSGRSDERPWAKLAAEFNGMSHVECPIEPSRVDLRPALEIEPSIDPLPVMGWLHRWTTEQPMARALGATAVFTGDGGDSGFCSDSVGYAVQEYLRLHGLDATALRLAARVALRTDRSMLSVLFASLRSRGLNEGIVTNETLLRLATQLVAPALLEEFRARNDFAHPWFQDAPTSWMVLRRAGTLASGPDPLEATGASGATAADMYAPLYAQPTVQLLLRIPIHVHFENGTDRGLARRAFQREVPAPILQRHWKDRAPGFYEVMIDRNLPVLREALLDGVLVQRGWLDREKLEQALSLAPTKSTVMPAEVMRHLHTELWARHWLRPSVRPASGRRGGPGEPMARIA